MIRTKLRGIERRADTARLGRHQVFPLVVDGYAAQRVLAPLRSGPDSYLGRDQHGRWRQVMIVPTREALVAARYRDWLAERDRFALAA